jgi:hypothetical protein
MLVAGFPAGGLRRNVLATVLYKAQAAKQSSRPISAGACSKLHGLLQCMPDVCLTRVVHQGVTQRCERPVEDATQGVMQHGLAHKRGTGKEWWQSVLQKSVQRVLRPMKGAAKAYKQVVPCWSKPWPCADNPA